MADRCRHPEGKARSLHVVISTDSIKVPVEHDLFSFGKSENYHVHQGFYRSLFPDRDSPDTDWLIQDLQDRFPAKTIIAAIREKAASIRRINPDCPKLPLWITGHSLGAAIGSILYAKLFAEDLGKDVELCDGYAFGTPMSSDATFVSSFQRASESGGRAQRLWRVINDDDFVTRVPPNINLVESQGGIGELGSAAVLLNGSLLDYSAVGYGLKYSAQANILPSGAIDVQTTCDIRSTVPVRSGIKAWITSSKLSALRVILQHSPRNYLFHMRLARSAMRDHDCDGRLHSAHSQT